LNIPYDIYIILLYIFEIKKYDSVFNYRSKLAITVNNVLVVVEFG